MPEMRNRGLRERYESAVNTARAMPSYEVGNPVSGMFNDLLASLPTPGDVGALMEMLGAVAQSGTVPGKGAMTAASLGPMLKDAPAAMLQGAVNHPFQTMLGASPGAASAVASSAPLHLSALAHHVVGRGRPMKHIPARYEPALQRIILESLNAEAKAATEPWRGGRSSLSAMSNFERQSDIHPRRHLGSDFPESGYVLDYPHYQPAAEALGVEYIPPDIGPINSGNQIHELSRTLGKAYFSVDPQTKTARVVDDYRFYPRYFSRFSGPEMFSEARPFIPDPPKREVAKGLLKTVHGALPKPFGKGWLNQSVEAGSLLGYLTGTPFKIDLNVPMSDEMLSVLSRIEGVR